METCRWYQCPAIRPRAPPAHAQNSPKQHKRDGQRWEHDSARCSSCRRIPGTSAVPVTMYIARFARLRPARAPLPKSSTSHDVPRTARARFVHRHAGCRGRPREQLRGRGEKHPAACVWGAPVAHRAAAALWRGEHGGGAQAPSTGRHRGARRCALRTMPCSSESATAYRHSTHHIHAC